MGSPVTTDLVAEMKRAMAEHDGDLEAMYVAGRTVLLENRWHPDVDRALGEFARILNLTGRGADREGKW